MAKPASRTAAKPASSAAPKQPKAKPAAAASGPSHPPYFEMIKEAISGLKERTGSSAHAIGKYMEEKHGKSLPANYKKMLSIQLRGFAAKGKLVKVKASYKLSDAAKKDSPKHKAKPAVAKPAKDAAAAKPKKAAAKPKKAPASAAGTKRKALKKKVVAKPKKSPAAKAKAKPKTVKSPVAKKARKAAAA
uniref:H15 domain-containing protein n=1 Tax=Leersia perrieri TaxID=77586 RepID=A0A0D9W9H5_9ORYZ